MISDTLNAAYNRTKWSLILRGVLGLAVGVLILTRPMQSVGAFAVVIALWALIDGIANVARGFALRGVAPHWGWLVFAGVVGVVFGGAALYYYPTLSLAFAVAWASLWLLLAGSTSIYIAVQEKRLGMSWGWTMAFGVVAVVAAVMAYTHPAMTLAWLMGLIAAFAIVGGIAMLIGAGRLSSAKHRAEEALNNMRSTNAPSPPPGQRPEHRDRGDRAA